MAKWYAISKDVRYLNQAKAVWDYLSQYGWDNTCGGGVHWKELNEPSKSKHTCSTADVYKRQAQNSSVEVQTNRIEVEGLVTDESKEPLIGVNVIIKDIPGLGAITDIDGKFKIKMEPYHRLRCV